MSPHHIPSVSFTGGLTVSKLGYGAMGITAFYGPSMEDDAALELLRHTFSLGVTHFDTAEVYKSGDYGVFQPTDKYNESILGKFFSTITTGRSSFTVATKYNPLVHQGSTERDTVRAAFDASLNRLGLQYVDLYYLHRMPETLEQLLTFMEAAKELVAEGRVKFVGLSEVGPQWLRKAHAVHPVACIQQEWSVATRNLETILVPTCRELGIGIVAYSPLARNLLTLSADAEVPKDWRAMNPRYSGENFEANKRLAARVRDVAARKGPTVTAAQLCLAWLYHQASVLGVQVVPIPGSTKIANVEGNVGSVNLTLTDAEFAELTAIGESVEGPRGNAQYQGFSLEGQLSKQ
eukprot:CAMPEP_0176434760 /NCGR_PEP_ID=MMETSP0127-20121128/16879_1 /TAXON_ID=938130 /ORGANISM="Platyophrya macrostoma, Strain WH" /LENGTH=348 /DNA_ID=CAMNT_0017817579 /DNA_START=50 /DNA_END=1096 /DNA_ORIENTATION=+